MSDIEAEIPSNKHHVHSSNSASFDESEHSFLSHHSPLFVQSDSDDARKKPLHNRARDSPDPGVLLEDDKVTTGRESESEVIEKVRSEASPSAHDFLTWNGYCQSFITKQTIKGCL